MAQPVFSILISTFCRAPLIGDAINSVLTQDFSDFEIIVSDNWSGDSTPEILATLTDPRITMTQPPKHCSNADNLEHALSLAKGTYVMVLPVTDALVGGALGGCCCDLFCKIPDCDPCKPSCNPCDPCAPGAVPTAAPAAGFLLAAPLGVVCTVLSLRSRLTPVWLAGGYVFVALLWLVPDRRIESRLER